MLMLIAILLYSFRSKRKVKVVSHLDLKMELLTTLLVIESNTVAWSELRYYLEDCFIIHLLPLFHFQPFTLVVDQSKPLLMILS